jgi:hypothetical protein
VLKKESDTGIYSFEMMQQTFCQEMVEEVENFEQSGLPVARPNSMNVRSEHCGVSEISGRNSILYL